MIKSKSKKKSKKGNKSLDKQQLIQNRREILAQERQAKKTRQKLFASLGACLAIALFLGLPLGLTVDPKIGLGVAVGIPSFILSFIYPKQALWFFLIYMPFSGTVVYWVAGGNAIFQLAKDIFYIPALLGLVVFCLKNKQPILVPKKLLPTLGIILFFALMTLFFVNGSLQLSGKEAGSPFLQGVLGLKVLLGYVPLIFCAYYLIEDRKDLLFLGRLLVVLAIICCVLGLVQYWMLDTGRCQGTRGAVGIENFKASLASKCLVGGALLFSPDQGQIRLPGTFVSPWHWAWFLISNSALTFTTAFSDSSLFWRGMGLVGMALVFINSVICGQRIALVLVPVIIITLLILTGQVANLKRFIPIGAGLGIIIFVAVASHPEIVQERLDSLIGRWNASPPHAFIEHQLGWAIDNSKGILGRGLGKATNSTRIFGDFALVETFHSKVIYEIGYLGTIAFMVFVSHLTILTFQSNRSLKDKTLRSFGSSFWVFILIISYFPYWYPLDTDPVAVYYWLLAGVIFRLPVIEKQEQALLNNTTETNNIHKKHRQAKYRQV